MKRGWYRICYTLCNFIIALFVLPCYIGTLLSACGIIVIFAEPSSATQKDLWWSLSLGVISVAFFIIMYIANRAKYYINACYICELLFDVTNTEVSPKSFTAEIHKNGKKFRWNSKLPKQEDLNCFFSALTTMYKDYGSERWYDAYREITDYGFSKKMELYPQILQFEEQLKKEHGSLWKTYLDKCMNTNFGNVTRKYNATVKAQQEIDCKKREIDIALRGMRIDELRDVEIAMREKYGANFEETLRRLKYADEEFAELKRRDEEVNRKYREIDIKLSNAEERIAEAKREKERIEKLKIDEPRAFESGLKERYGERFEKQLERIDKADSLCAEADRLMEEAEEKQRRAESAVLALEKCTQVELEKVSAKMEEDVHKLLESPKAIPFIADVVADYKTAGIEYIAQSLDYSWNTARLEKAAKIREIRRETQTLLKTYEVSHYQLKYILDLYPALEDLIDLEYSEVPVLNLESIENDYDRTREWLSKEEYNSLPVTERNQLSLDRYVESHRKNKWQIGRDYELYMGHMYSIAGYSVDTFGSYMGVEDLGRDLILKKKGETDIIVQCKYWSKQKEIHENHVMQLYGTTVAYKIEHYIGDKVRGYLVTNTVLSETAKKYADYLGIKYFENVEIGEYPRIKCNIGKYGEKIYHLPFDQQYDNVKICKPGECYATTVKEAEDKGFRRAFKWHGEK